MLSRKLYQTMHDVIRNSYQTMYNFISDIKPNDSYYYQGNQAEQCKMLSGKSNQMMLSGKSNQTMHNFIGEITLNNA